MSPGQTAQKTIGVAVIGAGWVSSQHIAAYVSNPHTRVLAVCDINPANARKRAEEAGLQDVAFYTHAQQAIEHQGVELVSVCTPQHVHCANVLAAARAGRHVIIEKPAANSLDELRRMQRAVEQSGVKTVVSFVLRWNPLFQNIKQLLARRTIGEVFYVEADYQSYNGAWWSGWEEGRKRSTGLSAMAVAGCHAIDALRWFAAPGETETAEPVEIFALSGGRRKGKTRQYDPIANDWRDQPPMEYDGLEVAVVRFANGVVGKVSVNFEAVQPYTFPLSIFGDRGTIRNNRLFAPETPQHKQWTEIPGICPDSADVSHHPFQGEIDHMVDCLLSDTESHCNLADAIKTHEVIFACQQCYET